MTSTKLVLGGAGAAAVLGIRVARSLHSRWRALPAGDRERLAALAARTKSSALDARGSTDPERAGRELRAANEDLAAALLDAAEADPQVDEAEVERLRGDLQRELERLASADIKASRGPRSRT
jgi:hypothetical protein